MVGDVAGAVTSAGSSASAATSSSAAYSQARGWVEAEPQHTTAKTSVWWDIENCQVPKGCDPHTIAQNISSALVKLNYCGPVSISAYGDTNNIPQSVQQALSSTGIALNHVPAGVKDASDKKILVDMLFWAVDNSAPANYLLISGDRDFSNCLHQLRMRRYNILLAQPNKASPALVAAAKTVWHWTSLSAGGSPLSSGESTQLASTSTCGNFNDVSPQSKYSESGQFSKPVTIDSENIYLRDSKSFPNVRVGDTKYKSKYIPKSLNHPALARALSAPVAIQETVSNDYVYQHKYTQGKQFKKAPHEFFGGSGQVVSTSVSTPNFSQGNSDPVGNDASNLIGGAQNLYASVARTNNFSIQQPDFPHGHRSMNAKPESIRFSVSLTNVPDFGNLGISDCCHYIKDAPKFPHQTVQDSNLPVRGHMMSRGKANHRYPRGQQFPLPSSSSAFSNTTSSNPHLANLGKLPPSEYVHCLISVILLTLDTLQAEKVMPTETNIADCIRFGEPKHLGTDVRKALDTAIEQNMVVKQKLGSLELYVGKNQKLWKCVNPIGGNPTQYPQAIWDRIEKFLSSSAGQSAILTSSCRYEAALILKRACMEDYALGDVLQILNMIIFTKKWIIQNQSGWQPIAITLKD